MHQKPSILILPALALGVRRGESSPSFFSIMPLILSNSAADNDSLALFELHRNTKSLDHHRCDVDETIEQLEAIS